MHQKSLFVNFQTIANDQKRSGTYCKIKGVHFHFIPLEKCTPHDKIFTTLTSCHSKRLS